MNPRGERINNEAGYGQGDRGNDSLRLDEERERGELKRRNILTRSLNNEMLGRRIATTQRQDKRQESKDRT